MSEVSAIKQVEGELEVGSGDQTKWTRVLRRSATFLGFVLRHVFAVGTMTMVPVAIVTVIYLILLMIALVTNSPIGSPVALPIGMIVVFVLMLVISILFLFPFVAIAELICRALRFPVIAQWPVSLSLVIIVGGLWFFSEWTLPLVIDDTPFPVSESLANWPLHILFWLIGVSIYWWLSQSALLIIESAMAFLRVVRRGMDKLGENISSRKRRFP